MGFNFSKAYNRPQESIAPWSQAPEAQPPIDYTDYGYLPGIAQQAQDTPPTNFPQGAPYFTADQLALANWFTTRVHLAPIGKV